MAQCCTPTEESVGVRQRNEVTGRWEFLEQAPQAWECSAKKTYHTFLAAGRAALSFPTKSLGFATHHCRAGTVPAGAVTLWPDFMPAARNRHFFTSCDGTCSLMSNFCSRDRSQQRVGVTCCMRRSRRLVLQAAPAAPVQPRFAKPALQWCSAAHCTGPITG